MAKSKVPFKTNVHQSLKKGRNQPGSETDQTKRLKRPLKLWGATPKKIKARKVNIRQQRTERIIWFTKWVVVIPLGIYSLSWIYLIFTDLFGF